jgi:type II secretory pathway component PulM
MAVADRARDFWDRISPRERKLVVLLAVAAPITVAIWLGLEIQEGLEAREDHNAEMRRALTVLAELKRRGPAQAMKDDPTRDIGPEALSLDTYLDNAARKAGFTLKGTSPHTPVSRNGFTTTSVSLNVDDLEIEKLKAFLQEIETASKVVVITTLETTRDRRDRTKIDAKLVVSTYSRDKTESGDGAPKKGG